MEELAKRMAELAEKVGPAAMDAARGAVKVEAWSCLASGALTVGVAVGIAVCGYWLWSYRAVESYNQGIPQAFAVGLFVLAAIAALCGLWSFIDPWTWTAMSNPDLWLAKKILKL